MRSMFIALAAVTGALAAAPAAAQDTDWEAMYAHVEEYWLQHREAALAEERDMSDPVWVGDIGPDAQLLVVEGGEARRVLMLLRDWANADADAADKIAFLPDLDRALIARFGLDDIGRMTNFDIGTAVAQLRANRDRVLDRYAGVLAASAERFQQARDARVSAEQPDLYRVYDSTYGEIHWEAGWYGDESKTIAVRDVYEDPDRGGWVVEGRWGRADDPDYDGGFSFLFGSPCGFAGSWWYGDDDDAVGTAWTGACQ